MPDGFVTYDREVLYDEVWAEPVRDVAKRYSVSDVALAKTCRRLAVPLPGRGYWAKKAAGKAAPRPPLPPLDGPDSLTVRRVSSKQATERAALIAGKEIPVITVAASIRRPHPLVIKARDAFPETGSREVAHSVRSKGTLDLKVSRQLLGRALRILDALIKALESRGMPVSVGPEVHDHWGSRDWRRSFETRALCNGESVTFSLREPEIKDRTPPDARQREKGWPWDRDTITYSPSGRLELAITNERLRGMRRTWKDAKRQRLEDCLGNFIVHVPIAAGKLAEIHAEDARREHAWREEAERREAAAERRREQEQRAAKLLERVNLWRQAEGIRSYVHAALAALEASGFPPEDEQKERDHLGWALEFADSIDPLVR